MNVKCIALCPQCENESARLRAIVRLMTCCTSDCASAETDASQPRREDPARSSNETELLAQLMQCKRGMYRNGSADIFTARLSGVVAWDAADPRGVHPASCVRLHSVKKAS